MGALLVRRIGQFLQMLDGAQRMFVHGVAMIEVAHDQRIDAAEFRQDFGEQPEALHRTQREAGIVGAQNFAQHRPGDFRIAHREFGMLHDVRDAALGLAAQAARRLRAASVKREKICGAVRQAPVWFSTSNKPSRTPKGLPLLGSTFGPRATLNNRCRSVCGTVAFCSR